MSADGVGHRLGLVESTRVVRSDGGVRSIQLVSERLADIVKQRRPTGNLDVQPHLRRHHAAQESSFHRMLPLVLRIAGAEGESPHQLHDVGMCAVDGQQGKTSSSQVERLAFHIHHNAAGQPSHRRGSADGSLQHAIHAAASDLAAYPIETLDANRRLSVQERELHACHRLDGAQVGLRGWHLPWAQVRQRDDKLKPLG